MKIKKNIASTIFCKYSKFMSTVKEPNKTTDKKLNNSSQFAESGIFVKEDDQDWGSAGMDNIQSQKDSE